MSPDSAEPPARHRGAIAWTLLGAAMALAVVAAGCRQGIPGFGFPRAQVAATKGPASAGTSADSQGHLGPTRPGAPYLAAIEPPDAGPGAVVALSGQNLSMPGLTVLFGNKEATYSAGPDGTLAVTVPPGASSGQAGVALGSAPVASSRAFQVLSGISILIDSAGTVGKPMRLTLSARDTAGAVVASPDVALSVVPPGAAQVTRYGQIIPLHEGSFTIQAVSGYVVQDVLAVGCVTGFSMTDVAGDGTHSLYFNDVPILTENATDAIPYGEPDGPLLAHLNNPEGMVPFTLAGKPGVLFSDSEVGLLRFVAADGTVIKRVVGGGDLDHAADPNGVNELTVNLLDPAGLALGTDPANNDPMVVIAERGRDRILGWDPATHLVRLLAGTGLPVVTDNSSNSNDTSSLGDYDPAHGIDGNGFQAAFTDPTGVTMVPAPTGGNFGIIYVADTGDHRIRRILLGARDSTVSTLVGTGRPGSAFTGSDGASISVDSPEGVAALPKIIGNQSEIYVADTDNNRILQILGDDANAPGASISAVPLALDVNHPTDVAISTDSTSVVAVADTLDNQVVIWQMGATGGSVASASCAASADPVRGIAWPKTVMFKAISANAPFLTDQVYFTDFFSDQLRLLDLSPG